MSAQTIGGRAGVLLLAALALSGCVVRFGSLPPDRPACPGSSLVACYRLRPDACWVLTNTTWALTTPQRALSVDPRREVERRMLHALRAGWWTEAELRAQVDLSRSGAVEPVLSSFLEELMRGQFLSLQVRTGNTPLFTVTPAPWRAAAVPNGDAGRGRLRLSRFAYAHRQGDRLVLESPLSVYQVELQDAGLGRLLADLSAGGTWKDLRQRHARDAGEEERAGLFLAALAALRFVEGEGDRESDLSRSLELWEFHDLLFHVRSQQGGHIRPLGGTYRFRDRGISPPPAVKPPMSAEIVALPRPDTEATNRLRTAFAEILDRRHSVREHGLPPLTLSELGAFLHTSARLREFSDPAEADEVTYRPSPSAGARHPLEIYVLARQCEGLAAGLYHYDPAHHVLERLPLTGPRQAELQGLNPFEKWGYPPPQVLLLLSARFGRTAWKYEGLAYRVVQNDLGCLEQTFYLVATALDLAPCVIGSVDPWLFASVTGVDPYEEPLLAAFTLGRRAKPLAELEPGE